MFDYDKIKQSAAAAVLAILLSTTAIGATVSPAPTAGPSLAASARVA